MSRTTEPLTEPTSDRIAPGLRCGPISLATSPLAPTGIETMTRSASFTACRVGLGHLLRKTEFGDALSRVRRARGGNDASWPRRTRAPRARSTRRSGRCRSARGARQWVRPFVTARAQLLPMNSASVLTVRRLASSEPDRHAQGIRQVIGAHGPRKSTPRDVRNASASFAVLPGVSGKMDQDEIARRSASR